MYLVKDWRKRKMVFDPPHYTIGSYYTDVHHKREMKHSFGDDLLNNLHLLPDPLKKNLADSIITSEEPKQKPSKKFLNVETVDHRFPIAEERPSQPETPTMAPFSGITNFISGVFNVITGAMSQLRPRSPVKYYDCFDESNVSHQGSQPFWHPASSEDQNKNERAHNLISNAETDLNSDMNKDCRSAVAQCEDKLNKVRLLLTTKPVETPKFRPRRPRKVFVEPGSVEENFEDAFAPEDFVSLSNDPYIEYYSPFQYQCEDLLQTDSPRMRTEVAPVHETTEIVKTLPVVENNDKNCTSVKSDSLYSKSVQNEKKPVKTEMEGEIVNNSNACVEARLQPTIKVDEVIENKEKNNAIIVPSKTDPIVGNSKEELVSSCEDKLSKLKALLQERRKNNKTMTSTDSATESLHETKDKVQKPAKTAPIDKPQDKRFKNPHRRTDKRRKMKSKKHINDDMMFAHEIHSEELSSAENSPSTKSLEDRLAGRLQNRMKCIDRRSTSETNATTDPVNSPQNTKDTDYFDEVSGRFHSTSATDSDDSFQIVFTDSPKPRSRLASDCDSEDSFIVFEDNPDSCYTTNDVFGDDSEDDDDYTDSDSELSDSGCISKLAHNLSRTIGDLTDDSLYDDSKCVDEVDCAVRTVCEEIPCEDIVDCEVNTETKDSGLLLTEAKKTLRKNQPPKKVQFSSQPPEVHVMRVWAFAARQARVGHWERYALDRDRFKRRIADVDMAVSWVLKPQHRSRVMFQRFMPWWNQLKRKELAEKKQKKEEEDRRLAEEKEREDLLRAEEKEREEQMRAEGKAIDGENIGNSDIGDIGKDTDRIDSCDDNSVCNGSDSNNVNSNSNTLEKDDKNKESSKEGEKMKKLNGKNGVCNNKNLIKNHKHLTKEERYDLINKKFNEMKLQNNIKKEIHIDNKIPRENINDEYKKSLHNLKKNNVKLSVIDEKLSGT